MSDRPQRITIDPGSEKKRAALLRFLVEESIDFTVGAGDEATAAQPRNYRNDYEGLVQALPDIVYELDEAGCFTFVNNSIRLLGYQPEELLGKHYSVLLYEDDVKNVDRQRILEEFSGRRTGALLSPKLFNERRGIERKTANLELRLRHKSSSKPSPADVLGQIISYGEISAAGSYSQANQEEFKGSVGIIRDITLRRKSEEMIRKLYQAVDQLRVSVFIINHRFEIDYINPCFLQLSGYSPPEVLGKNIFGFFNILPQRIKAIQRIVQDGFEVKEVVLMSRHGEGQLWVDLRLSPVRSPDGVVSHAIVVADDVNQQQYMEELLSSAKREAAASATAKSKFLSAMTHELKTPITSILTAAELLKEVPEDVPRRTEVIIDNARALMSILGSVLDYVRSEGDHSAQPRISLPLRAFIESTCEPYAEKAAAKGLGFDFQVVGSAVIETDPDRLGKAICVLLDNAIKFTKAGRVELTAKVESRGGNIPYLTVVVRDTGVGISSDDSETLFVPFSHNNRGARPFPRGAGLGLALARNMIRVLGGEIRFDSQPGHGSVFTLLVPVGMPVSSGQNAMASLYRVLLVDDNEVNLEYMRTLMENAGFVVYTAGSASEALGLLESRFIDAAVLDIYMPGYSGTELAQTIRSYHGNRYNPAMPLYAMTAYDPVEDERVEQHPDLFLEIFNKPVDLSRLAQMLNQGLTMRPDEARLELMDGETLHNLCTGALSTCQLLLRLIDDQATSKQRVNVHEEIDRLSGALATLGLPGAVSLLQQFMEHYADEETAVLTGIIQRVARVFELSLERRGRGSAGIDSR